MIARTDIIKKCGTVGTTSNKIQFYRTSSDGSWTLDEAVTLTAIVRGVEQSTSSTTDTTEESEVQA